MGLVAIRIGNLFCRAAGTGETFLGLRVWASVASREYKSRSGETKKANKVLAWITNKEKLVRREQPQTSEGEEEIPF
jgi:hypothetical protein